MIGHPTPTTASAGTTPAADLRDSGSAGPPGSRWRAFGRLWLDRLIALPILVITALLWELIARAANATYFPPLSAVVSRLGELIGDGVIVQNLLKSLASLGQGFAFTVVIGTVVGVLMGLSERFEATVDLLVYALLTAPKLVFAPIFFVFFSFSRTTVVALVIVYGIPYVILNTCDGVRGTPRDLVEMAASYRASWLQAALQVRLPAMMPLYMAGLRIAIAKCVKGMINGEMFVAAMGLGALVMQAGSTFDATTVLAVMLVVMVVAFVSIAIVNAIDRRVTSWVGSTERRIEG